MLHILMRSPFQSNAKFLIKILNFSDDFLAIQDGVIIAVNNNFFLKKMLDSSANLYVLKEDLIARGIQKYISSKFISVDYVEFVSLTVKHKKQIVW